MKRASLQQLAGVTFDIIVIGGGITGAAVARDAALRGLKVILVEKDDFASGTSSRSSKLIHGGLRYLETYQFGLVAESVRERELALRLAPHLTKVQPFLYMFYDDAPDKKWLLNLGLTFYDFVSGNWNKRRHKMLNKQQVLERQPQFRADGLQGAALFYDVSTDDARVTLDTVKSAADHGAQVINHCEVIGLTYNDNRCDGVRIRDSLTHKESLIKANYVVNSSGPWSDNILGFENEKSNILRPTKGVHIVLRKQDFPLHSAIFMRSPDDGRVVWPIPSMQDDRVFIGTTDTTYNGNLDDVHPEKEDIQYLLNVANHLMPKANLTTSDVIGSWAGLRPLIAPKDDLNNSKTPREHQILQSDSGIFSIVGGKLTSNRVMAKQLLDRVEKKDQYKYLSPGVLPYSADKVGISGAQAEDNNSALGKPKYSKTLVVAGLTEENIPFAIAETWAGRYGYNAYKLAKLWNSESEYQTILSDRNLTVAEIYYCINEEAARSLIDLLVRRTSEFFWDDSGGLINIDSIAQAMKELLDWSEEETLSQINEYYNLVRKHRPTPVQKPQMITDMINKVVE
ncbi:glycerol-3-phosphate dehydrogenase/oxidase [Vibrio sp. MA40-2]|uniref:glycerol-3-phosphate dehydrogenase/oxidase n=1 Tax=Vibrio sp. MA40-2 TaxID=3391828 RepID=UPI0039A5C68D